MNPAYVYMHHDTSDIYLKDRKLDFKELYCPYCEDHDRLLTVCDSEEELTALMKLLLKIHDLCPCDNYNELMLKYTGRVPSGRED